MVMNSVSTMERCPHNCHRLFWVSFSTARIANTTCEPCFPAPCSTERLCRELVMVVMAISLHLPQELEKHVLQAWLDALDRQERQIQSAHLGEQIVEPVLVRYRPAYATATVFLHDRETVEPRRRGRRKGTAEPDLIEVLAEAIKQRAYWQIGQEMPLMENRDAIA